MTAAGVDQYAAASATAACCIVGNSDISVTTIGQYKPGVNDGAGAYNNNAATCGAAGSQTAARAAGTVVAVAGSAAPAHYQPQRVSLCEWGAGKTAVRSIRSITVAAFSACAAVTTATTATIVGIYRGPIIASAPTGVAGGAHAETSAGISFCCIE